MEGTNNNLTCTKCGAPLQPDQKFCMSCGTPVAAAPSFEPATPAAPAAPDKDPATPVTPAEPAAPATPVEPAAPAFEPATPAFEPATPAQPVAPAAPVTPSYEPATPVEPAAPVAQAYEPAAPAAPAYQAAPQQTAMPQYGAPGQTAMPNYGAAPVPPKAKKKGGKTALIIVLILVLLAAAGGLGFYFVKVKPAQEAKDKMASQLEASDWYSYDWTTDSIPRLTLSFDNGKVQYNATFDTIGEKEIATIKYEIIDENTIRVNGEDIVVEFEDGYVTFTPSFTNDESYKLWSEDY